MKPDAEINALVAEHVAGLTVDRLKARGGMEYVIERFTGAGVPDYLNNANAVLPLLENAMHVSMTFTQYFGGEKCWVVSFQDGKETFAAEANTFPRAACLALLKAKGVDVS